MNAEDVRCREASHLDDTEWEDKESFEKRFGIPCPDINFLNKAYQGEIL